MYADGKWRDYVAMVNAVANVDDVFVHEWDGDWLLVCKQPLARETQALMHLQGVNVLPEDPVLVVSKPLAHMNAEVKVMLKSAGGALLTACTEAWTPTQPLTGDGNIVLDSLAFNNWQPDWPLADIAAQARGMAMTLFTLTLIRRRAIEENRAMWVHDVDRLIAELIGIHYS